MFGRSNRPDSSRSSLTRVPQRISEECSRMGARTSEVGGLKSQVRLAWTKKGLSFQGTEARVKLLQRSTVPTAPLQNWKVGLTW